MKAEQFHQKVFPLILAVIVGSGVFCTSCKENAPTVKEVEAAIKKELPIGTSKDQVLQFIKSRKFGSYKFISPYYYGPPPEKYLQTDIDESVATGILDVRRTFFATYSIGVIFYFDKENKLVDYKVEETHGE